jgi:hypothetical protein
LRGGAWDLEGDSPTYQWSVISQPLSANVSLTNINTTNCTASNMTMAGDYVFEFAVSDPTHTVPETLIVPVYPVNSAPVISNANALPETLMFPNDSTLLSATTSDPDGDTITHWWKVKTVPAGATPVFAKQGSPNTIVGNLTSAGKYVFTLTVVDRTKFTEKDVTVTVVAPGVDEEGNHSLPDKFNLLQTYPNPFNSSIHIRYALPKKTYTELVIYNIQGQLIRILLRGVKEVGSYTVFWDGKDENGKEAPDGIYFYKLKAGDEFSQTKKLLLLR